MTVKFTAPTTCRICGGRMEAGVLTTTRDVYKNADRYPFAELSSGELWFKLEEVDGRRVLSKPEGGPFVVLHYRCAECGYLELYANGKFP